MRATRHRAGTLVIFLLGIATAASGAPAPAPQDQGGRIKVGVDVVAVDVQVIDKAGRPVPDLGPEKFTVTINGKRRRVLSAEQVGTEGGVLDGAPAPTSGVPVPSRIIMIAVDCISFDATASRDVMLSVTQFVKTLKDDDYVGLAAYPNGAVVTPTRDHSQVLRALSTIVGQRDGPGLSQFHLRPTEIIDITRDLAFGTGPTLEAVLTRECGQDPGGFCQFQLLAEVTNTALYYEGQATASLGMLRNLVRQMQRYSGRKTLILVSGGMVASDSPGGRPDLSGLGVQVGKEAATANTAIYTLFLDASLQDRFNAEVRTADRTAANRGRDSAVLSQWLEQFAGAAGGALFDVKLGNADAALARVQTELASYYLLGVEPADEDRDGRTHEISVKTSQPGVTIRGRRWVTVPKSGVAAVPVSLPADSPAALPAAAPAAAVVDTHPVPADVQALATAYDRDSPQAFAKALASTRALSNAIRGFRMSDSPWPDDRKRTAVFALELGLAGLRSDNTTTREEGARLLAEYHARVREPNGADTFECAWFLTEASALEGLFMPEDALLFIPRAVQRCPSSPRLQLAQAFVSEQQWLRGGSTPQQEQAILEHYEAAMRFPETAAEARLRAGRFLYGLGQFDRALTVLDGSSAPATDPEVRYMTDLVRGQVLRALQRPDESAAAFRAALAVFPGAQSARVALMALLVGHGNRQEAGSLAEAVQTPSEDQYDPWWTYWLGDFRVHQAYLQKLREMAE